MIPVIEIDENGDLSTLWTDQVDLYEIGRVTGVHNASTVEFNEPDQIWEVIDASNGQVVHRDKSREKAIEWEIESFGPSGSLYKGGRSS